MRPRRRCRGSSRTGRRNSRPCGPRSARRSAPRQGAPLARAARATPPAAAQGCRARSVARRGRAGFRPRAGAAARRSAAANCATQPAEPERGDLRGDRRPRVRQKPPGVGSPARASAARLAAFGPTRSASAAAAAESGMMNSVMHASFLAPRSGRAFRASEAGEGLARMQLPSPGSRFALADLLPQARGDGRAHFT